MNIFKPYNVLQQKPDCVQLQLSAARKRLSFFLFRIFPFLLIGMLSLVFLNGSFKKGEEVPALFTALIFIVPLVLLFGNYITALTIDKYGFTITKARLTATTETFYSLTDVEKITCKIRSGKGGGIFYKLQLKTGSSVEFLRIPALYLKSENAVQMSNIFTSITGLTVEKI